MNIIILSIFAVVTILAFVEDYMQIWQKQIALTAICIILVCVAAFKPMTTTDAGTYAYYFYFNDDPIIEIATEPTYIWLSRLILALGGEAIVIFIIYALLSIPLKVSMLWHLTPYIFTAMIVYVGIYYPMHDVVQIRCGVATAFLLWSIVPLAKKQYPKTVALTLIATLFHYSALAFLPIILIGNIKITKYLKYVIGAAIPICLILYTVNISAVSLIPSSLIEGKVDLYKEMSESGNWVEYVPYKQVTFLAEFALLYIFLFFYDTIEKDCTYAPILIKILVFEMIFITMFAEIPVLGGRLHELFGAFDAIAFTCCLYCIKPKFIVRVGICLFSLAYYIIMMNDKVYFP